MPETGKSKWDCRPSSFSAGVKNKCQCASNAVLLSHLLLVASECFYCSLEVFPPVFQLVGTVASLLCMVQLQPGHWNAAGDSPVPPSLLPWMETFSCKPSNNSSKAQTKESFWVALQSQEGHCQLRVTPLCCLQARCTGSALPASGWGATGWSVPQ